MYKIIFSFGSCPFEPEFCDQQSYTYYTYSKYVIPIESLASRRKMNITYEEVFELTVLQHLVFVNIITY